MSEKMASKAAAQGVTRRELLKGTAALTGAAVGSGVIGAPMIWAQNLKDVTLNQVGPSYSVIADIAEKASADLGFKIVPQTSETTQLMAKVVNQPERPSTSPTWNSGACRRSTAPATCSRSTSRRSRCGAISPR